MNNHYIPKLLLRPFAVGEHVNTYNFMNHAFEFKKLKKTFSETDLFDEELEKLFTRKIEGPFGNLLHNKLLYSDIIVLNRQENLLLRKFLLLNFLRAPIINTEWDEMIKRTKMQNHPSVQAVEFLKRHHPEWKEEFTKGMPSADNYLENLRKVMEIDSLEDIAEGSPKLGVSLVLKNAARMAMATVIAFWDCTNTEQEFRLPKLPGISEMDQVSLFYKKLVLEDRRRQIEAEWLPEDLAVEFQRLICGSIFFPENYSIYPISPTRCIICSSPYFRAYFPIYTGNDKWTYPPLLDKKQFRAHFYAPPRMELFTPCKVQNNITYTYQVKALSEEEVQRMNALMLDMETEEFAFHDREKISDSFRYYDKRAVFAYPKKHDFSNLYA